MLKAQSGEKQTVQHTAYQQANIEIVIGAFHPYANNKVVKSHDADQSDQNTVGGEPEGFVFIEARGSPYLDGQMHTAGGLHFHPESVAFAFCHFKRDDKCLGAERTCTVGQGITQLIGFNRLTVHFVVNIQVIQQWVLDFQIKNRMLFTVEVVADVDQYLEPVARLPQTGVKVRR